MRRGPHAEWPGPMVFLRRHDGMSMLKLLWGRGNTVLVS
jgi:hypothetical protein